MRHAREVQFGDRDQGSDPILYGERVGRLVAEILQQHPSPLGVEGEDFRDAAGEVCGKERRDDRLIHEVGGRGLEIRARSRRLDTQDAGVAPRRDLPNLLHVGDHRFDPGETGSEPTWSLPGLERSGRVASEPRSQGRAVERIDLHVGESGLVESASGAGASRNGLRDVHDLIVRQGHRAETDLPEDEDVLTRHVAERGCSVDDDLGFVARHSRQRPSCPVLNEQDRT